ncbi:MAG: polymerase, partial [Thermoleophilaceae bacterium]|nr:polymerase [Thermoleophilaceae bacterium]
MADDAPELFLIDGNSLAYRAFYALPETIATSKGMPTNAIFGFASMLVKILTDYGQVPTLVVWDAGMSGRGEISEDYKAGRKARPDLLTEQWPHLQPLVEAMGYRNVKIAGFEADDVIASLAVQAKDQDIDTMIVTGDRDMFQLIEPGIRVMATARGITETKIYDRQAVIDRYGIPPELIPDFYGLKGDTSDNIPGIPGIGDKTASSLLQQFGDLETVLASVDQISGAKRKENLVNHAEDARMSKQLATAQREIETGMDISEFHATPPDLSRLREKFREYELRDPLRRLEEAMEELGEEVAPEKPKTSIEVTAVAVQPSELAALEGGLLTLAAERPTLPEDEEPPAAPGPLQFAAYAGGKQVMVGEAETLAALTLAWGDRPLVAHDWKAIASSEEPSQAPPLAHDTEVAAYLLDPAGRAYPLDELSGREGIGVTVQGGNGVAARAVATRAVAQRQLGEMEEQGLVALFREVELPLVDVLVDVERAGVKLDTALLAEIAAKVEERIAALERE